MVLADSFRVNKAIYVNNSIAAQRRQFNEERIQFLDKYSDQFPEIKTAKFTMKTHHQRDEEQKR